MDKPPILADPPYISNKRFEPIPSCSVDIPYLKLLFELATEINTKAVDKVLASFVKVEGSTDEQFEELKNTARNLYRLPIFIYGAKGESILSNSADIFDKPSLPHRINIIAFNNTTDSQIKLKRNPPYVIKIFFDFTKPDIFDWDSRPSYATRNNSSIELESEDQEWIEWAYNKIKDSIRTREKKVFWWHRSHVYDLLLWLLVVPLLFRNIYKFEVKYANILIKMSSVYKTALYLYTFLLAMYFFMLLFSYARWVFPYQEFIGTVKSSSMIHKAVIITVAVGILINLLSTLVESILPFLI